MLRDKVIEGKIGLIYLWTDKLLIGLGPGLYDLGGVERVPGPGVTEPRPNIHQYGTEPRQTSPRQYVTRHHPGQKLRNTLAEKNTRFIHENQQSTQSYKFKTDKILIFLGGNDMLYFTI